MIYIIPLISALIGWFTNYLAVKMLFHPRKKMNLLLFSVQGIFPKRQKVIAEKIGNMVANELISTNEIKEKIQDPENVSLILEEVSVKLDTYLSEKLPKKFPIIGNFFGGGLKKTIKQEFLQEFEELIQSAMEKLTDSFEKNMDLQKTVREKVENFSVEKLEQILMDILKKEFRFIELLGAIIGFLIGVLQIVLVKYVNI